MAGILGRTGYFRITLDNFGSHRRPSSVIHNPHRFVNKMAVQRIACREGKEWSMGAQADSHQ